MISTPQELFAQIDDLATSAWTLAAISTLFESGLAEALREPRTLGDLAARFEKGARFLDVGVGVGSLSIAMCRAFPQVRAVGLDVFEVPLGIARDKVARAGLADRIELRQVAIEDLKDEEAFDLVW